jgi:hypothetical protein
MSPESDAANYWSGLWPSSACAKEIGPGGRRTQRERVLRHAHFLSAGRALRHCFHPMMNAQKTIKNRRLNEVVSRFFLHNIAENKRRNARKTCIMLCINVLRVYCSVFFMFLYPFLPSGVGENGMIGKSK